MGAKFDGSFFYFAEFDYTGLMGVSLPNGWTRSRFSRNFLSYSVFLLIRQLISSISRLQVFNFSKNNPKILSIKTKLLPYKNLQEIQKSQWPSSFPSKLMSKMVFLRSINLDFLHQFAVIAIVLVMQISDNSLGKLSIVAFEGKEILYKLRLVAVICLFLSVVCFRAFFGVFGGFFIFWFLLRLLFELFQNLAVCLCYELTAGYLLNLILIGFINSSSLFFNICNTAIFMLTMHSRKRKWLSFLEYPVLPSTLNSIGFVQLRTIKTSKSFFMSSEFCQSQRDERPASFIFNFFVVVEVQGDGLLEQLQ